MHFRLIYILIFTLIALTLSCSTGPEFERDNINDPISKIFNPDVNDLILSIDSTKTVQLQWKDFSEFEDGFIIQKSYNDRESFFTLDTLDANITSYTDQSKNLAVDTFYRVRSYASASDSLGSTKIEKLSFDPLISVSVPDDPGNEVSISWETNSNGYADAYLIEKKINNNWTFIDTLENSISAYSYQELENIFYISIRISPLLINQNNELRILNSYTILRRVALNFPTDFSIETIYEDEVKFSWKKNSNFSTNFKISHFISGQLIKDFEIEKDLLSLQTLITPNYNQHEFILSAFIGDKSSNKSSLNKYIREAEPYNFNITDNTDNSVKLTWSYNNNTGVRNFVVERAINNQTSFETIEYLSPTARQFVDNNINLNNKYYYRLKTLSSITTPIIGVVSSKGLEVSEQVELNDFSDGANGNLYYKITNNEKYVLKANRNTNIFSKFDIENKTKIETQLNSFVVDFARVSPNQQFLALIGEQLIPDYSGPYITTIKILDFNTLKEINSFQIKEMYSGIDAIDFTHDSQNILLYQFISNEQNEYVSIYNVTTGNIDTSYTLDNLNCASNLIRHPFNETYLLHCNEGIREFDLNTLDRVLIKNLDYEFTSNAARMNLIDQELFFYTRIGLVKLNLNTEEEELLINKDLGQFVKTNVDNEFFYTDGFHKVFFYDISTGLNSMILEFPDKYQSVRDISYSKELDQILIVQDQFLYYYNTDTKWNIINN